ncbi:MAG: peptide-methionine (R)-S-oxide reductase MsrB [Melioribacteraceae bacterium]|nr:peptide-methionine (R)-S-oxide reductase MsrB [Melioribacteraceae bacterium]
MTKRLRFIIISSIIVNFIITLIPFMQEKKSDKLIEMKGEAMTGKVVKSEKEWTEILTDDQYHVLREKGTERPFTGQYWNFAEKGSFKCAACDQVLFNSDTKFDAGCGWPSFYDVVNNKNVTLKDDFSFGMHRIEVMCSNCGGHLGHLFDDGPKPTGQRYCINSVSIKFEKIEKDK